MPISNFLVTQETKNINRIYPKDLIEYSSFDNTLFESVTQGFGIDSIDHADLIPEDDNRIPVRIQDTGISVSQLTDCNPCNNCKSKGLIYYRSLQDDCRSDIDKTKLVKNIIVGNSTQNIPKQNSDNPSECLYNAVKQPHSILIDNGIYNRQSIKMGLYT